MDEAFASELERLARDSLKESKRYWSARGGRPETHSYHPAVNVTLVEVTTTDGVGTVHVVLVDDRYPGGRFGAHLRVPPLMEHEGARWSILPVGGIHLSGPLQVSGFARGDPLAVVRGWVGGPGLRVLWAGSSWAAGSR